LPHSVYNGLDVMQLASFSGGGAGRVYGPPKGFTILVFSCKSYLWNSVTAAKKQYVTQT